MTQAQVQYLANLETARHNRETEAIQSQQAAAAKEQASAATSRAETERAKIPAAYVPAVTSAGKGILALGGVIGRALKNAKASKAFGDFIRKSTGTKTSSKASTVVTSAGKTVANVATKHPVATAATALAVFSQQVGSYNAEQAMKIVERVGIDIAQVPKQQQYTFLNYVTRHEISAAESYLKTLLKKHPEWRKEQENEN